MLALLAFAKRPEPGVVITLVAKDVATPYSGMLPGYVAGFYTREEMHIDLRRLADRCGARLVEGEAVGFDRQGKRVFLKSGESIPYDVLSIDIGITPDLSGIAGAAEHGLIVKPIGAFLARWEKLRARALRPDGPRRIAFIGGGAAGLCLAFAVASALRRAAPGAGIDPGTFSFTMVSSGPAPDINEGMRRRAVRALTERRIESVEGMAVAVDERGIILKGGPRIAADAVFVSTHATPPAALRDTGWPIDAHGFLATRPTLQVEGDDDVFATGDCATIRAHPRPKAGVFAVRQGPVLARNLRLHLNGRMPRPFVPQVKHLVILATADGEGIAGRGRYLAFGGRMAWWLKDWNDRRFMRLFD